MRGKTRKKDSSGTYGRPVGGSPGSQMSPVLSYETSEVLEELILD